MNPPQVAKCAHLCYKQKNCFSKFDYGNTKCVLCTKVLSSPSKLSLVNEESSINMYNIMYETNFQSRFNARY